MENNTNIGTVIVDGTEFSCHLTNGIVLKSKRYSTNSNAKRAALAAAKILEQGIVYFNDWRMWIENSKGFPIAGGFVTPDDLETMSNT